MKFFKKFGVPLRFLIIAGLLFLVFILSYFRFFKHYELLTYDLRFKLRPALLTSDKIILIEISDDTLKNLGTWPLPRDFHASLIKVLKEFQVKSIVFDIIFSEPSLYDAVFLDAIKEAKNVYLPLVFYLPEKFKNDYLAPESKLILGELLEEIKPYAKGIGHINVFVDPDGKFRRIPLFIKYNDKILAHLGLKVACDYLGIELKDIQIKKGKVIIDKKLTLPIDKNTAFLVNYPSKWKDSFIHLSYFEILKAYNDLKKNRSPSLDLTLLKDKICFIGLTATGTVDLRANPLENIYPLLGLQASVFNSIINKKFIYPAGVSLNSLINILIFLISLLISLYLKPLKAFFINIILGLIYFSFATICFIFYGLWIDLFFPLLLIALSYFGVLIYRFLDELRKRQILEKELDIARTIQSSFLPQQIKGFSDLDISTFMQPAKFVAGDLYDLVNLDEKKLGVLIGDVAGKGVSASLIMAQVISYFRIFSRQYLNCSDLLRSINKEITGKFSGRFITCLYMIIDTQNYKVYVSSAGGGPLLFYKKIENKIEEFTLPEDMPLGLLEEQEYEERVFSLGINDKLIIFSDGLYEARNKKQEEFGLERVKKIILENAILDAQDLSEILKDNLFKFSRGLPQHDDITLIIIGRKE